MRGEERKMKYRYIQDPGHGWLEVPYAEVRAAGIAAEISQYSYRKTGMVYLEEDCDMGLFLSARNLDDRNIESVFQDPCYIRGYPRFHS